MKRILSLLLIITITFCIFADATALLKKLENKYGKMKTFEAEVVINTTSEMLNYDLPETSGVVLFSGKNFVVQLVEPMYQLVKYNDGKMLFYLKEGNVYYEFDDTKEETIFDIKNFTQLSKMLKRESESNEIIIFTIEGFDNANKVLVDSKKEVIHSLIYSNNGNTQTINLKNQKFNQNLSTPLDSFIIPSDAYRMTIDTLTY
jgi:outer membrane lipoprotein-sorting protein